jgi:hypothetical protein
MGGRISRSGFGCKEEGFDGKALEAERLRCVSGKGLSWSEVLE